MRRVAHVHSANGGPSLAVHTSDRRDSRRVRIAVVGRGGAGVRRDHDRRIGLADRIGNRLGSDVVVVGGAREAPGVSRIGAGARMRRVAHVHGAHGGPRLAVHTGDRCYGRRVRMAVVGHVVRRHHDRRIGLGDGEVRARVGDVIVGEDASRRKRGRDVIGTARHCLARVAAVTRRHAVRKQESSAATSGQRNRIRSAVGLAVGIRSPRSRPLVDRLSDAAIAGQVDAGGRVAAGDGMSGNGERCGGEAGFAIDVEIGRTCQDSARARRAVVESDAAGRRSTGGCDCGGKGHRFAINRGVAHRR